MLLYIHNTFIRSISELQDIVNIANNGDDSLREEIISIVRDEILQKWLKSVGADDYSASLTASFESLYSLDYLGDKEIWRGLCDCFALTSKFQHIQYPELEFLDILLDDKRKRINGSIMSCPEGDVDLFWGFNNRQAINDTADLRVTIISDNQDTIFSKQYPYNLRRVEKTEIKTSVSINKHSTHLRVSFDGYLVKDFLLNSDPLNSYQDCPLSINGIPLLMKPVLGGEFIMGNDNDPYSDASPAHTVELDSFYLSETVVTEALWKALVNNVDYTPYTQPGKYSNWGSIINVDAMTPKSDISYDEARAFIRKLNLWAKKNGFDTKQWRFAIPTEAQWEYAARGGQRPHGYIYSGSDNINDVANISRKIGLVKQKLPNELGLYDMSGTVWEWCKDWKGEYKREKQKNPQGPPFGYMRVSRGGSWLN